MDRIEIILIIGLALIIFPLWSIAGSVKALFYAVGSLDRCLHKHFTFDIPVMEDAFDQPLHGKNIIQALYSLLESISMNLWRLKAEGVERETQKPLKGETGEIVLK